MLHLRHSASWGSPALVWFYTQLFAQSTAHRSSLPFSIWRASLDAVFGSPRLRIGPCVLLQSRRQAEPREYFQRGFKKGTRFSFFFFFFNMVLLVAFYYRSVISFKRTPKVLLCFCLIRVKPLRQYSGILFQYQCC